MRDAEFFGNDRTAAAFVTKRLATILSWWREEELFARRRSHETNSIFAEGVVTARQRARRRRRGQLRPSEGLSRIGQSEGNLTIRGKGRGLPRGALRLRFR